MKEALVVIKALADRNRLRIIKLLQHKALCVCELTAVLGITQPSVSRHLRILRDAGLVGDERDGMWINYVLLRDSEDPYVSQLLSKIGGWLEDDSQVMADRRAAGKANRTELAYDGGDKEVA